MTSITTLTIIASICVALITAIIGPIIVEYFKKLWINNDKKDEDLIYKDLEGSVLIDEQIEILIKSLKADRVWVTQFHNGGHFYATGASIKKFSIFFETVAAGISKVQQQFQNTPTSFFSRSLKHLLENRELCINNLDDKDENNFGLKEQAQETGCKSTFMVALTTPGGKFHGTIAVEYVKEIHVFSDSEKNEIRTAAVFISGLLSSMH